jgi:hypothetical protein
MQGHQWHKLFSSLAFVIYLFEGGRMASGSQKNRDYKVTSTELFWQPVTSYSPYYVIKQHNRMSNLNFKNTQPKSSP